MKPFLSDQSHGVYRWREAHILSERQDVVLGVPLGCSASEFEPGPAITGRRLASVRQPAHSDSGDARYSALMRNAEREAPDDFEFYREHPKCSPEGRYSRQRGVGDEQAEH